MAAEAQLALKFDWKTPLNNFQKWNRGRKFYHYEITFSDPAPGLGIIESTILQDCANYSNPFFSIFSPPRRRPSLSKKLPKKRRRGT